MRYLKILALPLLVLALSSCASLTGSRVCECEYNETTGVTKWECESGAISESAAVSFGPKCEFKAGAQGARQGRNVVDTATLGEILYGLLGAQRPGTGVFEDAEP